MIFYDQGFSEGRESNRSQGKEKRAACRSDGSGGQRFRESQACEGKREEDERQAPDARISLFSSS